MEDRSRRDDLKAIFALNEFEFTAWTNSLEQEELDYVESLLDEVEDKIEEFLLSPDKLTEASKIITKILHSN